MLRPLLLSWCRSSGYYANDSKVRFSMVRYGNGRPPKNEIFFLE
jgi:hypothetical protein